MKILMLVNWKIKYCDARPSDKQPPDYYIKGEDYWFYRYFKDQPEVDVIDTSSIPWFQQFEKTKLRFYVIQAVRAIPKLNSYDLIVSFGMQSGVVISLWRRLFKSEVKHIVFDVGSFASASEKGIALRLMQFASKSIDGVIYHTSSQVEYYQKFFPWIVGKSKFIRFGTDLEFFNPAELQEREDKDTYMICVGHSKRDWDLLVQAYQGLDTDVKLRIVGRVEEKFEGISGIEQIPFIPINELISQIYNAKFCILPLESFNYSYGQMTLLQQMALGKCVIAAKVPSLVDYVEDGQTAVLYEPKNRAELQEKINQLLHCEDMMLGISENARHFLRNLCNEEIFSGEVEEYFKQVLQG